MPGNLGIFIRKTQFEYHKIGKLYFCAHFPSAVSAEDFRRTACTSLLQHVVEVSSYRRAGAKEEELHLPEGTRNYAIKAS